MDEVNINKYLAQFNPILVVPVLSAIVGAILVFVFGLKRQNEPRFTTASAIDTIKKSKRKSPNGKNMENTSAKVINMKKSNSNNVATTETSTLVTGRKTVAANEKAINTNMNKKKDEKKADEKRSDLGSPPKKVVNAKKTSKEYNGNNKKLKINKKSSSEEHDKKPADFDDDGWFTVTKKQQKNKNETDGNGSKGENRSPKQQSSKANNDGITKSAKYTDEEVGERSAFETINGPQNSAIAVVQSADRAEVKENKQNGIEISIEDARIETVVVNEVVESINKQPIKDIQSHMPTPALVADNINNANDDSAIAFDELGEWTDAKPDRKKGNKKRSRRDQ